MEPSPVELWAALAQGGAAWMDEGDAPTPLPWLCLHSARDPAICTLWLPDEGSFPPGHLLQTSQPPAHQSLALIKRQTYKQAQTLLPGLMEAAQKL